MNHLDYPVGVLYEFRRYALIANTNMCVFYLPPFWPKFQLFSDLFNFSLTQTGPGGLPYPMGYNETLQQAKEICANYSTPYIDLLLIHWPVNYGPCKYHGPR